MICDGCGNQKAWRQTIRWDDTTHEKFETCDRCGDCSGGGVPDVYFRSPEWVEHLADENDPKTWDKGTFVTSKRQKAEVMKRLNLRESGDRIHGARLETKRRIYLT